MILFKCKVGRINREVSSINGQKSLFGNINAGYRFAVYQTFRWNVKSHFYFFYPLGVPSEHLVDIR